MHHQVLLTSIVVLFAFPAAADPLIEQAHASTGAAGPLYVYEMEYSDGEVHATGKVDPSQPEGQRITIYTPDESEWDDDFRETITSIDSEVTGDIFCDDLAAQIPATARRIEETDDTVQFAFTPVPGEESDDMERKILKKVKASATLSKADGQVLSFSMSLPKPFKPAMIAKINTFQLDATCVRAPDGRTYLEAMQMDVSGSAMMQAFSQTVTQRITKLLDPVSIP
ncbi:hypothetical protein [Henriciella mobilis]|uniref:Uncharacterized protein n=1 Tax=Henriciella mobilis TaxID=2305467 RepID=A0A399RJF7_9PROT|nr:hypothetical protein [Henriciella mobilis]RIJ30683.1 hypothetical protein D1223_08690 [Henriciella mobilis]